MLKNYLDTLDTQDQNRAHMRSEGPAGCSKRPSHPPGGYPGRSERRGEAYSGYPLLFPLQRVQNVEPLSDTITRQTGTRLADFFNILLGRIVPELEIATIREIILGNYRIIYRQN
ncbi:MAG: hypothetical protein KatS3mg082_1853 [Nitrospiraceae bacterium]|nr:MAG: hypothetical protein KatS3mg082_1853 [Nitrospiraceae bacterium]